MIHLPSGPSVEIKPRQLLARVLNVLLSLHAHVEDGAVLAGANDFVVQATLAALALGPEAAEAHLELADAGQRLGVELAGAGPAVAADRARHFLLADEGLLAAHTRLRLLGELHEPPERRRCDGDGPRVLARQQLPGLALAQDRVEDTAQRLGELVVEVVLGVDGDVVLEHEDGIFAPLVILGAAGSLDDDVGDAIAERGSRARVSLLHSVGELDVGLFVSVVGFREGFCDDEFGHVDLVLEEVGDCVFDIAGKYE